MIIYNKAVNQTVGAINAETARIGDIHLIPGKGPLPLISLEEGLGKNGKPIVILKYEGGVIVEIPDYGIDKFRDGK